MPNANPIDPNALTTAGIAKTFAGEEDAWAMLERLRWSHGPICPFCGCVDNAAYLTPKSGYRTTRAGNETYRRLYQCREKAYGQQFSVLMGTVMEDTHIHISKWLMAMHLLCSGKNGVSAYELRRELGITYKSAWFLAHRIRYAMDRLVNAAPLTGTVEADGTYIGGKAEEVTLDGADAAVSAVAPPEPPGPSVEASVPTPPVQGARRESAGGPDQTQEQTEPETREP